MKFDKNAWQNSMTSLFLYVAMPEESGWQTELLTPTCFPILSQDKTLMALTAVGVVILNAHMFTAVVNGFTQVFIWELVKEFPS